MNKTLRHKQEFIEEMKQKLMSELAELENELKIGAHKEHGDLQANYPEYERKDEENAMEATDYAADVATTEAEESRLKEVRAALERIEQGEYGVTNESELIPENRLRANPAATDIVR